MIAAVLDTNVLASGFVRANPTSPPVQIVNAWRAGIYRLALSDYILTELVRTFEEPYFRRRLSAEARASDIAVLSRHATLVPIEVHLAAAASHAEDDPILATAVSAGAQYLVTGDTMLRSLGTYQGVNIVSPREFLDILRLQGWQGRSLQR